MICPDCKAEYREGFTLCADCEVALVEQDPSAPPVTSADHDGASQPEAEFAGDPVSDDAHVDSEEDPFCAFWEGDDPRICADICSVLDEAEIPYRVLRREPHLFRFTANSHIKVGVPFSLFEKAERAVSEAFSGAGQTQRLLRPAE